MSMLVVALALAALYLWFTGRLDARMGNRLVAAGLGIAAIMLATRGLPLPGALAAGGALAWWLSTERAAAKVAAELDRARALLGLGPEANVEAIRAAHRRLSAVAHPDRGGSNAAMVELNAARDLLLRHAQRRRR